MSYIEQEIITAHDLVKIRLIIQAYYYASNANSLV